MKQTLTRTKTFTAKFLSPTHIGTEERLDNHEFIYEGGKLFRFKVTPILERMGDEQVEDFVEGGLEGIKEWLRRSGLWEEARLYETGLVRQPNWFREPIRPFIADPLFRPYIPGTELKGAIRTAVVWWLIKKSGEKGKLQQRVGKREREGQVEEERDRRWAGQWLEQTLLGEDPNHDLLRALRVQDSTPVSPKRLKVFPVLIVVMTNGGLRWLQSPRREGRPSQYTDDQNQAVANFCECLDGSAPEILVTVTEDAFLLAGKVRVDEREVLVPSGLGWEEVSLQALVGWEQACNELAQEIAEKEKRWWERASSVSKSTSAKILAATMERFYDDLSRQIRTESQKGAVFVNLGWGSGWRSKTVTEVFGDETVQWVVNKYGLDRGARSRPFPKTRKVVWLGGNSFLPMGWMKLVPKG